MNSFRAMIITLAMVGQAHAQSWTANANGVWSVGSNWQGGVVPTSGTTTALSFSAIGLNGYTATNDLGPFTLRALTLSNETNDLLAVVNGAGSSLSFDGVTPNLFVGGPGPTSLSGGTVNVVATLTIRDTSSPGPGNFTLSSALAGAGGIIISRTSAGFLGETILNPTSNTLVTQTILSAGPLRLGSATALGTTRLAVTSAGSGLNAAADLRAAVPMTMSNGITLGTGATLNVLTGSAITLDGNIIGGGSFVLGDGITPGTPAFTINSTTSHTGTTRVLGGSLTIAGSITASPLVVGREGTAVVGTTTSVSANRLNATAELQGGILTMVGNATAGNDQTQTIATLNVQGFGTLAVDAQAATSTRLAVTDLVRLNRGTLRVRGDALGSLPFGTAGSATLTVANAALVGGGGAAGTTTRSILPFAVGSNALTGFGDNFVTVDGNGLRTLNPATEYAAQLPLTSYSSPAANNYRLTQSAVARTTPLTVNAVSFATSSSGIYGIAGSSAPLTVTSGAVLGAVDAHSGALSFGNVEALVTASNGTLILGPLTGTNGLTISGTGEAVLTNTGGLSGPLTVNGGSLVLGTTSALLPLQAVTLNGGSLSFRGFSDTLANPIVIGAAGGTVNSRPIGASSVGNSSLLTLSGSVTGSGNFAVDSGGRVALAGDNSGFAGTWLVNGGMLEVDAQNRLGTAPVVLGGGTLAISGSGTSLSNRIVLTESSTLMPGSSTVLTGPIDGRSTTAGLTWLRGSVAIENDVYYKGPTVIGISGSSAARGSDITVRGPGGSFRGTSSVTIHSGGALRIDNTVNPTANRLSRFPVTLAGGTLESRGSPTNSVNTTERLGSLTMSANTGSEILLRPFDASTTAARFDFYGGLTRETSSTLLISVSRLDQPGLGRLGAGSAGEGAVRFTTPPTLVNGILPNVFVSMTATTPDGPVLLPNIRLTTTVPIATPPAGVFVRELLVSDPGVVSGTFTGSSATSNVMFLSGGVHASGTRSINSLSLESAGVTIATADTLTLTSGQLALHNRGASVLRPFVLDPIGTLASPAGVDLTIGRTLVLSDGLTPVANLMAVAFAPGSGTVNFVGDGHVNLTGGPSPAIARINVFGGQVNLEPNVTYTPFPTSAHVHVSAIAKLVAQERDLSINTISGDGDIGIMTSGTLTIGAGNGSSTFSGGLGSGGGAAVIKAGTGTLRFTGLGSITGAPNITVTGGTLAFGATSTTTPPISTVFGDATTMNNGTRLVVDGVTSFQRPVTINGAVTLDSGLTGTSTSFTELITLQSGATLSVTAPVLGGFRFSGGFTGAGALSLDSGVTVLAGSTHSGGTTVNSTGLTGIASNLAFGTGPVTIAGSAVLLPVGASRTIANATTLSGNVTFGPSLNTDALSTGLNLTFTNITLSGAGSRTVTTTGTGNYIFQNLSGPAATGLTKAGGGTLTLAGTNTFAGPLTIDAGTLHVTGTKSGAGAVTVGTASATAVPGVLSGTGTVFGAVTVRAGGIVAPGASTGILTLNGGATFETGSTYLWELAANTTGGPGTNFDQLDHSFSATVIQSGAKLVPSFIGSATAPDGVTAFWQTNQQWFVIGTQSIASGSPFLVDNTAWASFGSFTTTLGASGGVSLRWTPVPEPASILAVGAITLIGIRAIRRRKARSR